MKFALSHQAELLVFVLLLFLVSCGAEHKGSADNNSTLPDPTPATSVTVSFSADFSSELSLKEVTSIQYGSVTLIEKLNDSIPENVLYSAPNTSSPIKLISILKELDGYLLNFEAPSGKFQAKVLRYNKVTNPYGVYGLVDLLKMGKTVGGNFRLINDIKLPDLDSTDQSNLLPLDYRTHGWMPLVLPENQIVCFDGNDKSLSNIIINRPQTSFVGLFAKLYPGSCIKNLKLSGEIQGSEYTGLLAGQAKGADISNLIISGSIKGQNNAGGVIGDGTELHISFVSANIKLLDGQSRVGGLVGSLTSSQITNSSFAGSVFGVDIVGGIAGNSLETISSSNSSLGAVNGTSNTGGIFGEMSSGELSSSYSGAKITAKDYSGGLVGKATGGYSIFNCYTYGTITSLTFSAALVGHATSGRISNCYSLMNVAVTDSSDILINSYDAQIKNIFYLDASLVEESAYGKKLGATTKMQNFIGYLFGINDPWVWTEGQWPHLRGVADTNVVYFSQNGVN